MVKRKFKVGKRYKGKNYTGEDIVIEITKTNGRTVYYKDVVGNTFNVKDFNINSPFAADLEEVDLTIVIYSKDNKVVALDKSTGEKAEANCNPADEFDFRTGAKLAFNRLMGEDVKPDNGVREVKRKAKVGEYIKIVDAQPWMIPYKKGDIFKVISTSKHGVVIDKDGTPVTLVWHIEYVVLENYKPEKEPENKDEICVGDTVKVTDTGKQYTTYDKWSGLLGYEQNFVYGSCVRKDEYKVLRIKRHDDMLKRTLALIQNPKTTQVFIINIEGIKNVER